MTDSRLRQDILDELDYDPSVSSENIAVAVNGGVVTLSGHAGS
jgi:osmotically-inducible protein OsmY